MSDERETIYVALLDEGIDVWRPVAAHKVAKNTYRILDRDYDPEVETWQFEPGTVVRCRTERRNGHNILVATEVARPIPNAFAAKGSSTSGTPS